MNGTEMLRPENIHNIHRSKAHFAADVLDYHATLSKKVQCQFLKQRGKTVTEGRI